MRIVYPTHQLENKIILHKLNYIVRILASWSRSMHYVVIEVIMLSSLHTLSRLFHIITLPQQKMLQRIVFLRLGVNPWLDDTEHDWLVRPPSNHELIDQTTNISMRSSNRSSKCCVWDGRVPNRSFNSGGFSATTGRKHNRLLLWSTNLVYVCTYIHTYINVCMYVDSPSSSSLLIFCYYTTTWAVLAIGDMLNDI